MKLSRMIILLGVGLSFFLVGCGDDVDFTSDEAMSQERLGEVVAPDDFDEPPENVPPEEVSECQGDKCGGRADDGGDGNHKDPTGPGDIGDGGNLPDRNLPPINGEILERCLSFVGQGLPESGYGADNMSFHRHLGDIEASNVKQLHIVRSQGRVSASNVGTLLVHRHVGEILLNSGVEVKMIHRHIGPLRLRAGRVKKVYRFSGPTFIIAQEIGKIRRGSAQLCASMDRMDRLDRFTGSTVLVGPEEGGFVKTINRVSGDLILINMTVGRLERFTGNVHLVNSKILRSRRVNWKLIK